VLHSVGSGGWKGCKDLPGTNTLAYYEKSKLTTVKSFITLAICANVINLFTAIIGPNKLEYLSLVQSSLMMFPRTARACPSEAPFMCFPLG
jgi:hypothetical protein